MQESMNYDQAQGSSLPAAGAPGTSENHSHDELRAAYEAQDGGSCMWPGLQSPASLLRLLVESEREGHRGKEARSI